MTWHGTKMAVCGEQVWFHYKAWALPLKATAIVEAPLRMLLCFIQPLGNVFGADQK